MDVDAYVAAHSADWQRLDQLLKRARRPRRLSGAEADELVQLYQRTATHLSVIQTRTPDPVLVARLSTLVARARSAVSGSTTGGWSEVAHFVLSRFPAAVWRSRRWIVSAALGFVIVGVALGWWIATHRDIQVAIAPQGAVQQLVGHDFKSYYSDHPAHDFAAQVWTNNVWVSAVALVTGIAFGIPPVLALLQNAINVGVDGGFMVAAGHGGEFFTLILPHGLLELSAVFIAVGVGTRLGWTVISPGARPRSEAVAQEGRAAAAVTIGLVGVLAVSGVLEAYVTPSGWPAFVRLGVGGLVWAAFVAYIVFFGRRAVAAGETGDERLGWRSDTVPTA